MATTPDYSLTPQEEKDIQKLNQELPAFAAEVWREMQRKKTYKQLQETLPKVTTRGEQDFLLKLMAEHPDHPRNGGMLPLVAPRSIEEIIDAKAKGQDCTEEESGRLKQVLNGIQFYFPQEFGEAQEQYMEYAGAKFAAMQPGLVKYKLRAECSQDVEAFAARAGKAISNLQIKRLPTGLPDVTATFDSMEPVTALIELMHQLGDSHVMRETVKPFGEYTGQRL